MPSALDEINTIVSWVGRPVITSDNTPATLIRDVLTIVKGFRNGLVYGAKIRLPHALVMTFLFRPEPFWEKIKMVCKLTKTHSMNLARFVAIYKGILILLQRVMRKEHSWHSFAAGSVGGYYVFAEDNTINNQIVMYLLARVLTAMVKLWFEGVTAVDFIRRHTFKIEATLIWGLVMYLFRNQKKTLQSSLRSSMEYLYDDSDRWRDLWTLLIHNK